MVTHSAHVWQCPVSPVVFDLLTCWGAAQGLLIFLCDSTIHYTNLFWAPTMCKALFFFFCLVDSGVNNSESGWFFLLPCVLEPWACPVLLWAIHPFISLFGKSPIQKHMFIYMIVWSNKHAYKKTFTFPNMRGRKHICRALGENLRGKVVFIGVRTVHQKREIQLCYPQCCADVAVLCYSAFALCTASYTFLAGDSGHFPACVCPLLKSLLGERGLSR